MKNRNRNLKRRLAGLSLGLLLLLPSCIRKDGKETYLYPSVTYTYSTSVDESILTTGLNPTYLYLANKQHPVDEDYDPGTLVSLKSPYASGGKLEERTAQALYAMMDEMRAAGISDVYVTSAYRTFTYQQYLYEKYITDEENKGLSHADAVKAAERYSAPPGYSEHQTGFVVDFMTSTMSDLDESFERTAAFAWLSENCYRFGFILRYPQDRQAATGVVFEPWHWRYVGVENALAIRASGLSLEEFLALQKAS